VRETTVPTPYHEKLDAKYKAGLQHHHNNKPPRYVKYTCKHADKVLGVLYDDV
jgi:hypothetical protein